MSCQLGLVLGNDCLSLGELACPKLRLTRHLFKDRDLIFWIYVICYVLLEVVFKMRQSTQLGRMYKDPRCVFELVYKI